MLSEETLKGNKMVHIQIDEDTAIGADRFQWTIKERRVVKGDERWEPVRFYTTFEQLCLAYVGEQERTSLSSTFDELLTARQKATTALLDAITVRSDVHERLNKVMEELVKIRSGNNE